MGVVVAPFFLSAHTYTVPGACHASFFFYTHFLYTLFLSHIIPQTTQSFFQYVYVCDEYSVVWLLFLLTLVSVLTTHTHILDHLLAAVYFNVVRVVGVRVVRGRGVAAEVGMGEHVAGMGEAHTLIAAAAEHTLLR